ncbi:MAG TPA: substrate-binding domain-containing protein [Bacteroidia bacterium]|nr:substrate-binding domain-containing protein [Bacteroidia bacterium]
MKIHIRIIGLFLVITFYSCNNNPVGADYTDTPTSGKVNISVDESYALLFDTQIYTFEALYPNAKVIARFKPEQEALQDLLKDSSKVAVLNRELTKDELNKFKTANIYPKTTKIAEDAIALVVHNNNLDTALCLKQVKSFLTGNDTLWPHNKKQKINIVFDNPNSANYRYLKNLINNENFGNNVFAVKSNPEVISYVSSHENAIGVVSVNWISDMDDTLSQSFLKKVKVVGLTDEEFPNELTKFRKPKQAYIANKSYPLCRSVYMINRQTRAGLGTGFVSFVAGEKGQRMMKLAGLVPATMQVRLIQITNKPLQ